MSELRTLAERLAVTPTQSTKHMSVSERIDGIETMLCDLDRLARQDGCIAAAWALEKLVAQYPADDDELVTEDFAKSLGVNYHRRFRGMKSNSRRCGVGVDTTEIRHMANRLSHHSLFSFSKLSDDVANELDALRKSSAEKDRRISQLERLVCSGELTIWRGFNGAFYLTRVDPTVEPSEVLSKHDTQQAAIAAAIKLLREKAGDAT